MQEQVNFAPGENADLRLGRLAHCLDPLPPLAQHNGPLALAGDDDLLADAEAPIGEILPALLLDRQRIGRSGRVLANDVSGIVAAAISRNGMSAI